VEKKGRQYFGGFYDVLAILKGGPCDVENTQSICGGELMEPFLRAPPPTRQPAERAGRAILIDLIGFFQTFRAWALARTLAMRFFYAEAWVAGGKAGAGVQEGREPMQNQWKKAWGNNGKSIGTCPRTCHVECAGSFLTSEVKRPRAWLVLGWGAAWEDLRVLPAFLAALAGKKE
jgi:hypothetical protein